MLPVTTNWSAIRQCQWFKLQDCNNILKRYRIRIFIEINMHRYVLEILTWTSGSMSTPETISSAVSPVLLVQDVVASVTGVGGHITIQVNCALVTLLWVATIRAVWSNNKHFKISFCIIFTELNRIIIVIKLSGCWWLAWYHEMQFTQLFFVATHYTHICVEN